MASFDNPTPRPRVHFKEETEQIGDSLNNNNRTPEEALNNKRRSICPPPPAPSNKKIALPIVRSKVTETGGPLEAGAGDIPQVLKGSLEFHGFPEPHPQGGLEVGGERAQDSSKIPKSLQNIVVRHKIAPTPSAGSRKERISPKKPVLIPGTGSNLNSDTNQSSVKTLLFRGIEMRRVDGKPIAVPQGSNSGGPYSKGNTLPKGKATSKPKANTRNNNEPLVAPPPPTVGGLVSGTMPSNNKTLKRKSVVVEPSSIRPAKSKGKVVTLPQSQFRNQSQQPMQKQKTVKTPIPAVIPRPQRQEVATTSAGGGEGQAQGRASIAKQHSEAYKTLQEFLTMPPSTSVGPPQSATSNVFEPPVPISHPPPNTPTTEARPRAPVGLGQSQGQHPLQLQPDLGSNPKDHADLHKQAYYKSKFWDYVDPSKLKENKPERETRERPYDPETMKTFIEKQKEIRRIKEIAEMKEKQALINKKKAQLKELNEKARKLGGAAAAAARLPPTTYSKSKTAPAIATTGHKIMQKKMERVVNLGIPPPQPTTHDYQVPARLQQGKQPPQGSSKEGVLGMTKSKKQVQSTSDSANNAESGSGRTVGTDPGPPQSPKVFIDRSVATTDSLGQVDKVGLPSSSSAHRSGHESSSSSTSVLCTIKVIRGATPTPPPPPTQEELHSAASRIQAAFKGYKIRKILSEAHLIPKDLVRIKQLFQLQSSRIEKSFTISKSRLPEKPYDDLKGRGASSLTSFLAGRLGLGSGIYLPPPPQPSSQLGLGGLGVRRSCSGVLPSTSTTSAGGVGGSRKSFNFNEPYPKEALQRLQAAQAVEQESVSLSRRNSLSEIKKCGFFQNLQDPKIVLGSPAAERGGSSAGVEITPKKSSTAALNTNPTLSGIKAPWPTISAALSEKLRLYKAEKKVSTPPGSGGRSVSASATSIPSAPENAHIHALDKDFESISSIHQGGGPGSQDISITDDYFGPSDSEFHRHTRTSTPINAHPAGGSKVNGSRTPSAASSRPSTAGDGEESGTNVETDEELAEDNTLTNREPDSSTSGHSTTTPTTSSLPVPALKLKYHAEQERLAILEKAIAAASFYEKKKECDTVPQSKPIPTTSEIQAIAKQVAEERFKVGMAELEKEKWAALIRAEEAKAKTPPTQPDSTSLANLQLEMMKCHQEAAKASVQVSKWMAEMGKSLLEDRHHQRMMVERVSQQQIQPQPPTQGMVTSDPVNLAAIVYAAVDEAQRIVGRERTLREDAEVKRILEERKLQKERSQPEVEQSGQNVALQFPSIASEGESQGGRSLIVESESGNENEQEADGSGSGADGGMESFIENLLDESNRVKSESEYDENKTPESVGYEESSFLSEVHTQSMVEEEIEPEGEAMDKTESFIQEESQISQEAEVSGAKSPIPEQPEEEMEESLLHPQEEGADESKVESVSELECEVGTGPNLSLSGDISHLSLYEEEDSYKGEEEELEDSSFLEPEQEKQMSKKDDFLEEGKKEEEESLQVENRSLQQDLNQAPSPIQIITKSPVLDLDLEGLVETPVTGVETDQEVVVVEAPPPPSLVDPTVEEEKLEEQMSPPLSPRPSAPPPPTEEEVTKELGTSSPPQPQRPISPTPTSSPPPESVSLSLETETEEESIKSSPQRGALLSPAQKEEPGSSLVSDVSDKYSESFLSEEEEEEEKERVAEEKESPSASLIPPQEETQKDDGNRKVEESKSGPEVVAAESDSQAEVLEVGQVVADLVEKSELLEIVQQRQRIEEEIREIEIQAQKPKSDELSALGEPAAAVSTTQVEVEVNARSPASRDELDLQHELEQQQRIDAEAWSRAEMDADVDLDFGSYLGPPPPPYSSPPFDALLYTLHASVAERRAGNRSLITELVNQEVDRVWGSWTQSHRLPPISESDYSEAKLEEEILGAGFKPEMSSEAEHLHPISEEDEEDEEDDSFEQFDSDNPPDPEQLVRDVENITRYQASLSSGTALSLRYLVRDCIRLALKVEELTTPTGYVDTIRRGTYALAALEAKVPKTKEELISAVTLLVHQYEYTGEGEEEQEEMREDVEGVEEERQLIEPLRNASLKWNCRLRDVVENFLVGETLEEEPQWLNIWPEALQLSDEFADKIIKDCVHEALKNFEEVFPS